MASMKLATVSILALAALASPAAAFEMPFGLGGANGRAPVVAQEPAPVLMAQAGDGGVRISQMEEEMRRLTGKVEELSFLVLQLQEQLRKAQEDNEFRFQDLEGKGSGASAKPAERRTEAAPVAPAGERLASAAPPSVNDASRPAAAAPQTDEIGALLGDTSLNEPAAPASPATGSSNVASIATNGPVEMYSLGYNYMLAGDYQLAENTFRQYTQAYPNSQDAADAQYWLGESLYAQKKYRDAAEVFLNAQKSHPKSTKAPEMMLKLGMSLARLNNRETACVTYAEVGKRYPDMSANVKKKLQGEEKSANCA